MPQYISVKLINTTLEQHYYFVTDDFIQAPAPVTAAAGMVSGSGFAMAPGELALAQLVVSDDGHGHATGGYPGNSLRKTDLNDGDVLYP
jgi:hypothetical protein